jgi:hypothetical protein
MLRLPIYPPPGRWAQRRWRAWSSTGMLKELHITRRRARHRLQEDPLTRAPPRKSELAGNAFVVSELYRIKRLSQGKVKMVETGTGDTEVVTAFLKKSDDEISGNHRILVYLVPFSGPAGDKYADSAGGAVAVYDYSMAMTRQ